MPVIVYHLQSDSLVPGNESSSPKWKKDSAAERGNHDEGGGKGKTYDPK
jgi:hypothetical protein